MATTMLKMPTFGPPNPSRLSILPHFNPIIRFPLISYCSQSTTPSSTTEAPTASPPPLKKKKKKYRKLVPGEKEGITEEMRFVAMKLRNKNYKVKSSDGEGEGEGEKETWQPSMNGFLKYLVDSKLVFAAIERIVDESQDVSYAYFRDTGLERCESFSRDIEWFGQQGVVIPEPSNPGITYVKYLEELAATSPSLFLCHFYNIYFSHVAGGQVIAKQVSEKVLEGKDLEVCRWEGDAEELLNGMREKLNALGQHWTRDEKSKGLREAAKAFKYLGQIIRLIIL